jgi:hypothetical protein
LGNRAEEFLMSENTEAASASYTAASAAPLPRQAPDSHGEPGRPAAPGDQRVPGSVRAAAALRYLEAMDAVHGWLHFTTAIGFLELLWWQEEHGTTGLGIAEIGIHHGKSFLVLAAGAVPGEPLLAIDLFERQDLNLDLSGQGNRDVFLAHLAQFFPATRVEVIASPSDALWSRIPELGLRGLRFFSVDGGHTRALTLNDLRLADAALAEGGVCALDDVFNTHWTGVVSGLADFLRADAGLVPFAFLPNKLMLCRPRHAASYAAHLRAALPDALEKRGCEFLDWSIDIFGERVGSLSERLRSQATPGVSPRPAAPPFPPVAPVGPIVRPDPEPRVAQLRTMFNVDGIGLEIGPLHSPVAPKREGFRVEVLDHATAAGLRAKYAADPHVDTAAIEEVDFVSDGRPLHEVVGTGRVYDWIIASHIIEHLTDPIGFLRDCEALLRPGGRLVLAVPDRRKCFDALRPVSTLGALLDAQAEKRSRHRPGALFDSAAYSARLAGSHAWSDYDSGTPDLVGNAAEGMALFQQGQAGATYIDAHGWVFTPASFRLLLLDLLALGRTGLREASFLPSPGCEFFVALATDGVGCPLDRSELARAMLAEAGAGAAPPDAIPAASGADDVPAAEEALAELHDELEATRQEAGRLREEVAALRASTSWRVTIPLRVLRSMVDRWC